jgi:hypothetical protein
MISHGGYWLPRARSVFSHICKYASADPKMASKSCFVMFTFFKS